MGIKNNENKPAPKVRTHWRRLIALFTVVALITGIAIFALDGVSGYSYYEYDTAYNIEPQADINDAPKSGPVYIDVDGYGNVSVFPLGITYSVNEAHGHLIINVPSAEYAEDIFMSLPQGWEYVIASEFENGHSIYILMDMTPPEASPGFAGITPTWEDSGYTPYDPDGDGSYIGTPPVEYYPDGGEIGSGPVPFNFPITVTSLACMEDLQAEINFLAPNSSLTIYFDFPGNELITNTAANSPTLMVGAGVKIYLDSYPGRPHQTWTRNHSGRHFILSGGAELEILNVTLNSINAADGVGGVRVNGPDSHLIMNHANATISNIRFSGGGAVDVRGGGFFTMYDGFIRNSVGPSYEPFMPQYTGANSPQASGGVMIWGPGSVFNMYGGTIRDGGRTPAGSPSNHRGNWSGGGVAVVYHGRFYMHGGTITNNFVGSGGGGVAVRHDGVFTMYDGLISHNTSSTGAGVLAYNRGSFFMYGGIIENNNMGTEGVGNLPLGGGGVAAIGHARVEMRVGEGMPGGIIRGNQVLNSYANQPINRDGGGVWISESPLAVHVTGPSIFRMYGGYIYDNDAINGGGVFVHGGRQHEEQTIDGFETNAFVLDGGYIFGNRARYGGGVCLMDGNITDGGETHAPVFQMLGGIIGGNSATYYGGGVYVYGVGGVAVLGDINRFDMTGGTIGGVGNISTSIETNIGGTPGVVNFPGRNTALNGGGVYLTGGFTFQMANNAAIVGNLAFDANDIRGANTGRGGGLFIGNNSNLILTGNSRVEHNVARGIPSENATGLGGGIYVGTNSVITMQENSRLAYNEALTYHVTSPASPFAAIYYNSLGGGVYVYASLFNLNGSAQVTGNSARSVNVTGEHFSNGGGVHMSGGTFMMSGSSRIHQNEVTAITQSSPLRFCYGGGVFITGGIFMMNSPTAVISNNHALSGGGVKVFGGTDNGSFASSTFVMNAGVVGGNRAADGSVLHGNTAAHHGGGISVTGGAQFSISGPQAIIRGNEAPHGGGVFVAGGHYFHWRPSLMHMTGGLIGGSLPIHQNRATASTNGSGGGVRVAGEARFYMGGGIIQNNRAIRGGGVAVGGNTAAALSGEYVFDTQLGDYIWVAEEEDESAIEQFNANSTAPLASMGITPRSVQLPMPNYTFFMHGGARIIDNDAYRHGGGVHVSGGEEIIFVMDGVLTEISGNMASAEGGFSDSNPVSAGGGVNVMGESHFEMRNGNIFGNTAEAGGGVNVTGFATTFEMQAGHITDNTAAMARNNPDAHDRRLTGHGGGGVSVTGSASFALYYGFISSNRSYNSGGGVNINGLNSYFNMQNGHISENYLLAPICDPSGNGGGVHVTGGALFEMYGGGIAFNISTRFGGGVHVFNSIMYMRPSETMCGITPFITNNTSVRGGGGVSVAQWGSNPLMLARLFMYGGNIEDNGHPVFHINNYLCLLGEEIETQEGGGVIVLNGAILEMRPTSTIAGNKAHRGGGVYLSSLGQPMGQQNSMLYIFENGGHIENNTATGYGQILYWFYDDLMTRGHGGGIYIGEHSEAILEGGLIYGNVAEGDYNAKFSRAGGGGIYVVWEMWDLNIGGRLSANGTRIWDNHATRGLGGGIFTEDYEYNDPLMRLSPSPSYGNLTLTDVNFQDNTAFEGLQWPPSNALDHLPGPFPMVSGAQWGAAFHPLNNYDINYRSVLDIIFRFRKTDCGIYDGGPPFFYTPLEGAVFRVYWQVGADPEDPNSWVPAYDPNDPFENYYVTSGPDGWVEITFRRWQNYRIVEVEPPTWWGSGSFELPPTPHFWEIIFDGYWLNVIDVVSSDPNDYRIPPFVEVPHAWDPGLHYWYLGNYMRNTFRFYKTDQYLYDQMFGPQFNLLPGAQFRLFKHPDPNAALGMGNEYLITLVDGEPVYPWVEVELTRSESSDVPGEYIYYHMAQRYIYQLVETFAPDGFMIPFGQWRIRYDGGIDYFITEIVGTGMTPSFVPPSQVWSGMWYLGNLPHFGLPMAGANITRNIFVYSGFGVVGMGMVGVLVIVKKKAAYGGNKPMPL